jgi:2-polyprenyl-3-methyl-5-hydroxy-6-metoxy-1,4-benzoquinol methylase
MKKDVESETGSVIGRCLRLLETGGYFVHRERPADVDAEYWNRKPDPDGNIRDIESERAARMEDVRYIADWLNALPPGRLLDVGCGLGELLEQIDVRHETHGIDGSSRSAEVCRARTRAQIRQCDVKGAAFPSGYFDAIAAHHVIEHVDEPVAFVREVRRILKPGGKFVVGTPDFSCAAARRFGDRFRLLHDATHVSLFTEDSLLRLLRDEGFVAEATEKPFFGTRFATPEAFAKMATGEGDVSPPFYGSFLTVFARKKADEV